MAEKKTEISNRTEEKVAKIEAPEDETLVVVNKKIRTYKKKLAQIDEIEKKVANRVKIIDQQEKVLNNKDISIRALQDFTEVRDSLVKILDSAKNGGKSEKEAPVAPASVLSPEHLQAALRVVVAALQLNEATKVPEIKKKLDNKSLAIEQISTLVSHIISPNYENFHESIENGVSAALKLAKDESLGKTVEQALHLASVKEEKKPVEESPKEKEEHPAKEVQSEEVQEHENPEVHEGEETGEEGKEEHGEGGQGEGKFERRGRGRGYRGRGRGGRGRGRGGQGGFNSNEGRTEGYHSHEGAWETPTHRPRGKRFNGGQGRGGRGGGERGGSDRGGSPRGPPRTQNKA